VVGPSHRLVTVPGVVAVDRAVADHRVVPPRILKADVAGDVDARALFTDEGAPLVAQFSGSVGPTQGPHSGDGDAEDAFASSGFGVPFCEKTVTRFGEWVQRVIRLSGDEGNGGYGDERDQDEKNGESAVHANLLTRAFDLAYPTRG
jgi:hypothetical protein